MNTIFNLVYAANCNGTHHKLAMDGLRFLKHEAAADWRKLFLRHADAYVEGSKAPDKKFKDFKNHVLHVRENYWGGAEGKAQEWYDKLVAALRAEKWEEAVYNAGVLSHYYTDPVQPFHTGQTEAESTIHRAAEWSISKSYNELWRDATRNGSGLNVPHMPSGEKWVGALVRQGAEFSNQYYEKLIAHYNFDLGVTDPPAGLNQQSKQILSVLILYAAHGMALLLDRAFAEANVKPPQINLTLKAIVSTFKIPLRWVTNKMEDAAERKTVQAIYDELQQTGTVEKNLPEDDRVIRDAHKLEVLGAQAADKAQRAAPPQAHAETLTVAAKAASDNVQAEPEPSAAQSEEPKGEKNQSEKPQSEKTQSEGAREDREKTAQPEREEREERGERKERKARAPRIYLDPADEVEAAPSIGAKTAAKLDAIGIVTVADLLNADPAQSADKLGISYISAQTIRDWQDQARLVCLVPGLRGHDAQILVGCGKRLAGAVASADYEALLQEALSFCDTSEGKRVLRGSKLPDLEEVTSWVDNAKLAGAQDAA